jgi:hypothetical protein
LVTIIQLFFMKNVHRAEKLYAFHVACNIASQIHSIEQLTKNYFLSQAQFPP